MQFGTRARPPFTDRGGRSGGGNRGAGSNSGGRGDHWGNGHRGRRGSPSGRPPRGGFSPRPSPRFHTNNVSVPEQGDDAAVRQIVQANSASPHFVGLRAFSAEGIIVITGIECRAGHWPLSDRQQKIYNELAR